MTSQLETHRDKQLALYSISELFREANKKLQALPDEPDRLKNKVAGLSLKTTGAIDDHLLKEGDASAQGRRKEAGLTED